MNKVAASLLELCGGPLDGVRTEVRDDAARMMFPRLGTSGLRYYVYARRPGAWARMDYVGEEKP